MSLLVDRFIEVSLTASQFLYGAGTCAGGAVEPCFV